MAVLDRRDFLQRTLAAGAAAGLAPAASAWGAAGQRRPNVLFVLADQWRHQAFAHAGDPNVRTPHFDRLAAEGARFQRCYAANPVCTPNRSCILTGLLSHQHRMIQNNLMLPPEHRTLAEPFAAAGYRTHYIGKWHMDGADKPGFVPPGWRRRGFATFEGFNRGHYYPSGAQYFSNEGELLRPDVYEPTYQTDLAIDFLRRRKEAAEPFFCYLSWGPPHTPYRPPAEWNRYDPERIVWRDNVPRARREDPATRRGLAGYYGLCESLDHEMGRLLEALDQLGLGDDTLLVFTSDHGDMHGSHGLEHKGKPEDESLHVPLFMRWPGRIAGGQRPETLLTSIDLMPSILSAAGLAAPEGLTGRDRWAAAVGGSVDVASVYTQGAMTRAGGGGNARRASRAGEWRCLVSATHKLIVRRGQPGGELFDLERDPYEMNNLFEERSQAALRDELLKQMRRWGRETGDPFPEPAEAAQPSYTDEQAAAARA